jgi:hypothetical protein
LFEELFSFITVVPGLFTIESCPTNLIRFGPGRYLR